MRKTEAVHLLFSLLHHGESPTCRSATGGANAGAPRRFGSRPRAAGPSNPLLGCLPVHGVLPGVHPLCSAVAVLVIFRRRLNSAIPPEKTQRSRPVHVQPGPNPAFTLRPLRALGPPPTHPVAIGTPIQSGRARNPIFLWTKLITSN